MVDVESMEFCQGLADVPQDDVYFLFRKLFAVDLVKEAGSS